MTQERKPCDGTWNDYQRHKHFGERACAASLAAWRLHCAENRAARRKKGKAE